MKFRCKFCKEKIKNDEERVELQTGESSHKECLKRLIGVNFILNEKEKGK